MRGIREFIREEDGVGVVELILILVVLIGLVLIFKDQLTSLVNDIFDTITKKRRERSENEKESKYYGIFRTCVCAGGILPYGSSGGGEGVPDTDVCRYGSPRLRWSRYAQSISRCSGKNFICWDWMAPTVGIYFPWIM